MKFASLSLIVFIAGAVFYIRIFAHGDDPAGPTMLGIIVSFAIAAIAGICHALECQQGDILEYKDELLGLIRH